VSSEKTIAEKLLQINAIKLSPQNPFQWASGILSPIYCDNRIALSYPETRSIIANAFSDRIKSLNSVDCIAGVATAGIPHGAIAAHITDLPFIYVRDKAKSHGRQNQIEGEVKPNSRVVLIEDLISTGGSSIKAADVLEAAGCEIVEIIAIFSYNMSEAESNFKEAGLSYHALSNYDVLIDVALEGGYIQPEMMQVLREWKKNPKTFQFN